MDNGNYFMSFDEMQAIGDRYNAAFGNMDELAFPEIITEPQFLALLEKAVVRGQALTVAEVQEVFPDAAWEEVQD